MHVVIVPVASIECDSTVSCAVSNCRQHLICFQCYQATCYLPNCKQNEQSLNLLPNLQLILATTLVTRVNWAESNRKFRELIKSRCCVYDLFCYIAQHLCWSPCLSRTSRAARTGYFVFPHACLFGHEVVCSHLWLLPWHAFLPMSWSRLCACMSFCWLLVACPFTQAAETLPWIRMAEDFSSPHIPRFLNATISGLSKSGAHHLPLAQETFVVAHHKPVLS